MVVGGSRAFKKKVEKLRKRVESGEVKRATIVRGGKEIVISRRGKSKSKSRKFKTETTKRIPTTKSLSRRSPRQIERELRRFPDAGEEFKKKLKQGFTGDQAKEFFKRSAEEKVREFQTAQVQRGELKQAILFKGGKADVLITRQNGKIVRKKVSDIVKGRAKQQTITQKIPLTVSPKAVGLLPTVLKTQQQKFQSGIAGLKALGLTGTNVVQFFKQKQEEKKQQVIREAQAVDDSIDSFIKRANLVSNDENKRLIKKSIQEAGVSKIELDRSNTAQNLRDLVSDKSLESLYRFGISNFKLGQDEVRQFINNRDVKGFNNLIKKKITQKQDAILTEKKLTDVEKADKLKSFYDRVGVRKGININGIPYFTIDKNNRLVSSFQIAKNANQKENQNVFLKRVIEGRSKNPLLDITKGTFDKVSRLLFKGAELANQGINIATIKREINFDEQNILGKGVEAGKVLLNFATALPRATKKGLLFSVDDSTKRLANVYKSALVKRGFEDPITKKARDLYLASLKARQRGLEDIRKVDPNFDRNSNILLDDDVIDTAFLFIAGPLISKIVAKLGQGAKVLARSKNPLVSLIGRVSKKGIRVGVGGIVAQPIVSATIDPNPHNLANLLLLGSGALRGGVKSVIKRARKIRITESGKLKRDIDSQLKLLKDKGIKPQERQFKEVQKLNLLKQKLINIQKSEVTLLDRLDNLRKSVLSSRNKRASKQQQAQIKSIQTKSKNLSKTKKKLEQTIDDFKVKPKEKKEKVKTNQKELREIIKREILQTIKSGKRMKLKELLLLTRELKSATFSKIIKRDLLKEGFKFKIMTSKTTGKPFVNLKKTTKPLDKLPSKQVQLKARAKEKILERQLKKKPKREEAITRRIKTEIELQKAKASVKATKEDVQKALLTASKKAISFEKEVIQGVKKSSISKKTINEILNSVIEGQRNPNILKAITQRFDKQFKQIQIRAVDLKKELNKLIGFTQLQGKEFKILKKKSQKGINKIKQTLKDLGLETIKLNKSKKEFLESLKKNKLDVAKTASQLDELMFARRQKQFRDKAKKTKILFEKDIRIKPKSDEIIIRKFLGEKLGTIEIIFKKGKLRTQGLKVKGKRAELRAPISLPKIQIKFKKFNNKGIKFYKDRVVDRIRQNPLLRRNDQLFNSARKQKLKLDQLSRKRRKPKRIIRFKVAKLNKSLLKVNQDIALSRLNSLAFIISNAFDFDTSNLSDITNITAILQDLKKIQAQINDLDQQTIKDIRIIKDIKREPLKDVKPIGRRVPPKKPNRLKEIPKKDIRNGILRKRREPPKEKPLLIPRLTFDSKLPQGTRLSFDGFYRERINPNQPADPKTNPIRKKRLKLRLPLNRAIKLTLIAADNTNPRSIEPTIVGITKKKDIAIPKRLLAKFRLRKTKTSLRLVEKSKFAIDTPGEKQGLSLAKFAKKTLKKKVTLVTKKKSKAKSRTKKSIVTKSTRRSRKVSKNKSKPSKNRSKKVIRRRK